MAKVTIKSISGVNRWDERYESTEVYVDGELIGDGNYGGEPEDNVRYRDYSWVEPLLEELAKRLGADVMIESEDI
jgi:hypothetical protein